jgi:P pilus assembly chaperone PapD
MHSKIKKNRWFKCGVAHLNRIASTLCVLALTIPMAFAVGVKPVRTELIIDPGGSGSATIRVINSEGIPVTVRPEVTVYTKNDEEGFPVSEDLNADHPMNIHDWIEFPEGDIELEPNSEEEVTFTVSVPEGAQPGGRYASILYTSVDEEATSGGVKIQAAVPSLILVKVTGEEVHAGEALSFGVHEEKLLGDKNPLLAVSFQNSGNVHEKPRGSITLTDANGVQLTEIAKYRHPVSGALVTADAIPLNLNGGNVLPGSSRTFTAEWNENIQAGKFTATLELKYGKDEPAITQTAEIEIEEDLELVDFTINQLETKTDFTLTLTNNGNIFERPEGKVEIVNEFDNIVASPEVPTDAEYIAPGSTASITIPWLDKQVPKGKYTAKLAATHGFADTPLTDEVNFSSDVVDYMLYGMIGGGALVLILLVAIVVLLAKKRKPEATA